uniref:Uncharacterized protein n=1 Tax=Anguilla anguilla TaxID=7936 RepID=A0A0E9R1E5_ANGAN
MGPLSTAVGFTNSSSRNSSCDRALSEPLPYRFKMAPFWFSIHHAPARRNIPH